ncbi:MAG: tetratricopeptide repeat protein [Steroidobacter sp.]
MNKAWVLILLCVAACSSPPPRPAAPLRDLMTSLQTADTLYRKQDLKAAAKAYEDVLAIDPQSVQANVRLGVIAHRQGEYPRAEQYFNRVLSIDPRNDTAAYNLAVLHVEQAHEMFKRYLMVSSTKAAERPAVYELQRAMQQFRGQ